SYFAGLQAGYNWVLPSRLLLGVEADISFPNTIAGNRTLAAPGFGGFNFGENVEILGTLRARVGQVFSGPPIPGLPVDHWLAYATGGFAWSYDQFTRTQIVGMPPLGLMPGTVETMRRLRAGGAAGVGVEVPLAGGWTGRLEYLFTGFAPHALTFPLSGER